MCFFANRGRVRLPAEGCCAVQHVCSMSTLGNTVSLVFSKIGLLLLGGLG